MSAVQWTSLAQTITGTTSSSNKNNDDDDDDENKGTSHTQSHTTMSSRIGVRFVSDEVKRDHRDLEILYKGLMQAIDEGDDAAAAALQNQFSWELARHLVAMQLFVFPGTEQRADEGNGKALRRRGDLAAIRDHLLNLIDLSPSDEDFRSVCVRMNDCVKQHIKDVERTDLVAIEKALNSDESERMAADWERVGQFVPSKEEGTGKRREVPFETVKALLEASYGEVRRAWEGFGKGKEKGDGDGDRDVDGDGKVG